MLRKIWTLVNGKDETRIIMEEDKNMAITLTGKEELALLRLFDNMDAVKGTLNKEPFAESDIKVYTRLQKVLRKKWERPVWHCVFCGSHWRDEPPQVKGIQCCPKCKEYKGLELCDPRTCKEREDNLI